MNEKQQAKMQAKIDKIEPVLQQAKEILISYKKEFSADHQPNKKENRLITKMQNKIKKIEDKIATLRKKCGATSVTNQIDKLLVDIDNLLLVFK